MSRRYRHFSGLLLVAVALLFIALDGRSNHLTDAYPRRIQYRSADVTAASDSKRLSALVEGDQDKGVNMKELYGSLRMRGQTVTAARDFERARPILATRVLAGPAGNTITVNSILDVANSNDGLCTLREAISAANSNVASGTAAGECAAGSTDADTISLNGVSGTISLSSALPNITSQITFSGPGQDQLTISGNDSFRVFQITGSMPVNFSGLTIANGRANQSSGGGIYNQNLASVNVIDCTIRNNVAQTGGGISNGQLATFAIINSTVDNNSADTAAGCYNPVGTLTIVNSTLNNNSTTQSPNGHGGAISNGRDLNIINSTLDRNVAWGMGGGIFNSSSIAIMNITSSTLTENSAALGGGGINNYGGGTIKLLNNIIAQNGAQSGPDLLGPFVSLGHNLLTNFYGSTGFTLGTENANGDLVGASFARVFPLLGPLQNNGGSTQTRALMPGSPAIDAADNCVVLAPGRGGCLSAPLMTDQRGVSRQSNSTVDMGAYESRPFILSVTSGSPQSAPVNTSFAPLVVTVTSVAGDPVAGVVRFNSPTSGPSAILSSIDASIGANGQVTTAVGANGLAGGPYIVTATINRSAASGSFSLLNTQAATNTTLTSSSNPSDLTQSITFSATVTSTGPLTGTVQFKIDGSNSGAPVSLSGGVATLTSAELTVGTHSVTADYSGDANFLPSSATLVGGQVVRPPPSLSINDISFKEGDTGTKLVFFTVTSSAPSNLQVRVNFATADNTATSPSDYQAASGTLAFNPGQVIQTIFVTIIGDTNFEPDETFTMNLSSAVNATIVRTKGTATIENDEAPVLLAEVNTNHAIALDSVTQTRDPFSLTNAWNLNADHRTSVSLFVWRLGLLPGDTVSDVTVQAEDDQSRVYLLIVEYIAPATGLDDVNQVVVRLPDAVSGTPRNLWLTVRVRGLISNKAFLSITGP